MVKRLTLDDLLSLPDADQVTEEVQVRELGIVTVRAVSLDAHRKANDECRQGDTFDWERWDALALHHCMVDPEVTYDQALKLRRKAAGVSQDILDAIWRVSGLTERGEIKAVAVDDAEAAFREGQSEVSDVPAS